MWAQSIMTILFRGLMVMHRVETRTGRSYMEIGILPSPHHFLRINTIKNCVIASTTLLEHNVDPADDKVNHAHSFWRLVVDNPVGGGVSTNICDHFDREDDHGAEEDFRWIVDLETEQMFGTLGDRINTDVLLPIMIIPSGVFYTRLKSPHLSLVRNGTAETFGCLASVTGCDIPILEGRVRLVEQGTNNVIFDFKRAENTIYEVANTPPDVEEHAPENPCHDPKEVDRGRKEDQTNIATPDPCAHDHFKNYYRMFKDPSAEDQICFTKADAHPAPDPFLCGITMLSQRKDPLRQ